MLLCKPVLLLLVFTMSSSLASPLCVSFLFCTSLAFAAIKVQCVFPPTGKIREWRLVRVAFEASMASYSSCLIDRQYLVNFYISHQLDYSKNAINKHFWLQYHSQDDIMANSTLANTHSLRPTDTSETYTTLHKLLPFQKYLILTHSDIFIHGPFDFAIINN